MIQKGLKALMREANDAVETLSIVEAQARAEQGALFVDVRESGEYAQGHIPGAVPAPRGFLEFVVDPEGPMHQPVLASGQTLIVYCGSGGRSLLACRTLKEMGLDNIVNLAGGFQAWAQSGGAIER